MESKPWYKSKTVWTGIGGLAVMIGTFFVGEVTLIELIEKGVVPLGLIFVRLAVD